MYEIKYDQKKESSHGRVLEAVLDRVSLSEREMADNYTRYRKSEESYLLYKKQKKEGDAGLPSDDKYKAVKIPATYSMLLTAHTYWINVFLNKPSIFQVQGTDGGGVKKEMAMEAMLQYQVNQGKMLPNLVIWLLDVARYGVGIVGDYWAEDYVMKSEVIQVPEVIDGVETGRATKAIRRTKVPKYKGNKVYNILPYDFLPDPRVALCHLQQGEFCGRKLTLSWNDIVKGEAEGRFFNTEAVKKYCGKARKRDEDRAAIDDLLKSPEVDASVKVAKKGGNPSQFYNVIEMYIDLIPAEWDLGESKYPEKWVFTLVDKKVIIGANPLGLLHNRFPIHPLEYEVDGYKQQSRGILEIGEDLNSVLDWLFNSHMYNKRSSMNNQFVYDPSRIVERDLTRKDPGKMIRVKPTAFGTDVRSIIHQLPVADVTQSNFNDANLVESQMQRLTGINEDVAGVSQGSSRRSAAEFRGTTSFAAQRLAKDAFWFSVTGWASLGECLISNTQQLYDSELKVRVAGDTIIDGDSITVKPDDIAGQFDLQVVDGTQPVDRMAQAQFWQNAMGTALQIPGVAEQYRLPELFEYVAKLGGLKAIGQFKFNPISDEQLLALVNQWKMTGGNNGSGQTTGGAAGAARPDAVAGQASGVDSAIQPLSGPPA